MLHRYKTLFSVLCSTFTPAYHIIQELDLEENQDRFLHFCHAPRRGYTLYETYTNTRMGHPQLDLNTWAQTFSFKEALHLFALRGASPQAIQAAQQGHNATLPAYFLPLGKPPCLPSTERASR